MQQIRLSSQAPYDSAILEFLNTILSSSHFWTNTIKELLVEKYGFSCWKICVILKGCQLSEKEREEYFNMSTKVGIYELFVKLEELLGVRFSNRIKEITKNSSTKGVIISTDLEEVFPKVLSVTRYC